jgi:hypothetical protein
LKNATSKLKLTFYTLPYLRTSRREEMPSGRAGALAGGPPASSQQSQEGEGEARRKRDSNHLQKAIEDIKAYLAIVGLPGKLNDAWERVERAGTAQVDRLRSTGDEKYGDATA